MMATHRISKAEPWLCRSCSWPLGLVSGGTLDPKVPDWTIDRHGVAKVMCPGCKHFRLWKPEALSQRRE
jgi:hypothetical protein